MPTNSADGPPPATRPCPAAQNMARDRSGPPWWCPGSSPWLQPPVAAAAAEQVAANSNYVTPIVRKLAAEKGVDLAKVQAETGAEVIDETVLAPYLKP